jgi:pimeloyl-ACP methyl ester carboxylesterase
MSNLFYTENGDGLPVILIHGFCETNEIWNDFKKDLSPHFKVLCPDLPGFGKSRLPEGEISIESISEIIAKWLKEKKITECVMIGHSLGGYVALHVAEAHQDIINGLGLFHSSAFADSEEKKENRNKSIEFVKNHGSEPFVESTIPSLFYEERRNEFKSEINRLIDIGKKTSDRTIIAYTEAMRDREEKDEVLQFFTQKVLIIAGDNDNAVPVDKTMAMEKLAPQTTFHLLEKTGHMGMIERKQETLSIVRNFCFDCI